MTRIFLLLLLIGWMSFAEGQEVRIERSKELMVLKGKTYYLHTVRPGQTLFSICKFYGVDIATVKKLNGKTDDMLSVNEVLRIPQAETYRPLDDRFYYHRMRPKETLYSVSRKFGIRLKRILKDNPEYDVSRPIATGAMVRLALKQIDRSMLDAELAWERKQVLFQEEQPQDSVPAELPEKRSEEIIQYEAQMMDTIYPFIENSFPSSKEIRVALLLPFYVEENKLPAEGEIRIDSLGINVHDERFRLCAKSEPFIQFYEGFLMAVDSLKKLGYIIDLNVYDTERSVAKVNQIADELNFFSPQLIIGPVYANIFEALAERLTNTSVPMIYPLSARTEGLWRFPNLIQVNSSMATLLEEMAGWIAMNSLNSHIVAINAEGMMPDVEEKRLVHLVRSRLESQNRESIATIEWYTGIVLNSLKEKLDSKRENVILFPTINQMVATRVLPLLSALAEHYSITVIGFPEWLKFTALDDEILFKLNVKVFMNSYVDYQTETALDFAARHWEYFYSEPSNLANRAFDIGMFFIPRIAESQYGWRDNLLQQGGTGAFTHFKFKPLMGGGIENCGFYMIHFGSDYQIHVKPVK